MIDRFHASLLVVALAVAGCRDSVGRDPGPEALPVVRAVTVEEHLFHEDVHVAVTLEARQLATLVPGVPGRVASVEVRPGDAVQKGDVLVRMEDTAYRQGLLQAQAAATMAQARLQQAEAAARRIRALAAQDAIPDVQLEEAEANLALAQAAVEQADAQVAIAREQVRDTVLRAPFDGTITARNLEPGEVVGAGASPLPPLQIADLSAFRVVGAVGEAHLAELAPGLPMEVSVTALPGRTFQVPLERVNAAVDPLTRTIRVEGVLEDPDGVLSHGLSAQARIEGVGRAAPALPREALLDREDGTARVLVLEDGDQAVSRTVRYGRSDGALVPVLEGLEPGAQVLVGGHTRLAEGATVRVLDTPGATE